MPIPEGVHCYRQPGLAKVYVTPIMIIYFISTAGIWAGPGPLQSLPLRAVQWLRYHRLLNTGPNVLAAIVHWQGNWKDSGVNAKPAFLLEARIAYPDGTSLTLGSDSSWKVLAHTPSSRPMRRISVRRAYQQPGGRPF